MDELVERLARAIMAAGVSSDPIAPARAVLAEIEAMGRVIVPREIPQDMFLRAEKAGVSFSTQQRVWSAMISAALASPLPVKEIAS